MNPVGWVAMAYAFFNAVPAMVSFAKTLKEIIDSIEDFWARKEQLGKLNDALKAAHETGDTSALEQFFSGRKPPSDPAKPSQLPNKPANP